VAGGWCWTGVREKHCWLAGNQPAEQGHTSTSMYATCYDIVCLV
jgi:hypothetical protein